MYAHTESCTHVRTNENVGGEGGDGDKMGCGNSFSPIDYETFDRSF